MSGQASVGSTLVRRRFDRHVLVRDLEVTQRVLPKTARHYLGIVDS